MDEKLKWSKPAEDRIGRLVRTSKCGRYQIVKRHYASARNGYFATVAYVFTVLATGETETLDTLRAAKDAAEMSNDPNWEPA